MLVTQNVKRNTVVAHNITRQLYKGIAPLLIIIKQKLDR